MELVAEEMIGFTLMVRVTRIDAEGHEAVQHHFGPVLRVDRETMVHTETGETAASIVMRTELGEELELPFAPDFYAYADPGDYEIGPEGETVRNPDFVSSFRVWDAGTSPHN